MDPAAMLLHWGPPGPKWQHHHGLPGHLDGHHGHLGLAGHLLGQHGSLGLPGHLDGHHGHHGLPGHLHCLAA